MKKSKKHKNRLISAGTKANIIIFSVTLLVSFLWMFSLSQTGLEASDMLKFSHAEQVSEKLLSLPFVLFVLFFSASYSLAFIFPRVFKKQVSQIVILGNFVAVVVMLPHFGFSLFFFFMGVANAFGLFQTARTSEKISARNSENNKMFSFASNTVRDGLFFFTFLSVFASLAAFMPYQEELKQVANENFVDFLKLTVEDSLKEPVSRQDVLSELEKQKSFQSQMSSIDDPQLKKTLEECTIQSTLAYSSLTQSKMIEAMSSPQFMEKIKQDTPLRFFYDFFLLAIAFSVMVVVSVFAMIFGFIATTYLLAVKYLVKIFNWLKQL